MISHQIKQPKNPSYRHAIIAPNPFKWQRMVETPVWKENLSYSFWRILSIEVKLNDFLITFG
jgi:hypothetical protein